MKVAKSYRTLFARGPGSACRGLLVIGRGCPSVRIVGTAQIMLGDVGRDVAPQTATNLLLEPEVDPAVDTRVVNIVRDLLERRVVKGDPGDRGIRESDRMATGAIQSAKDLGTAARSARVVRRVTREARRRDEGDEASVGIRLRIVIGV